MNKSNHRKYNWELAPTYSEDVKLYGTTILISSMGFFIYF